MKAKPILDHVVVIGDPILERDLLNVVVVGLGSNHNYISFVTSLRMRETKLFLHKIHDSYDMMLIKQGRLGLNKDYQSIIASFHKNSFKSNSNKGDRGQDNNNRDKRPLGTYISSCNKLNIQIVHEKIGQHHSYRY